MSGSKSNFNLYKEIRPFDIFDIKKDLFKLKKIISTSSLVSQKEVINQIEQLIEEETIWRNVAFKFLINYLEGIGEVKKAEKYKILMKN